MQISLFGLPINLRPIAILPGLGVAVVAYLTRRQADDRWLVAVLAALLWYKVDAIHVGGHVVSSRAVNAPMDYVDYGFYPASGYTHHDVSPQQHIGRASGGVIASALGALVYLVITRLLPPGRLRTLARIAAIQNALLLLLSLMPTTLVDGGVIYTNLRKLRADAATQL